METAVRTPLEVFSLPQRLVVPLFQRAYVWEEAEQWEPFWQDVRRLADLRLRDSTSATTHFLGAVVVQAHEGTLGALPSSSIIDGQQRLTTLQLLMSATAARPAHHYVEPLPTVLHNTEHLLVVSACEDWLVDLNRSALPLRQCTDPVQPPADPLLQNAGVPVLVVVDHAPAFLVQVNSRLP